MKKMRKTAVPMSRYWSGSRSGRSGSGSRFMSRSSSWSRSCGWSWLEAGWSWSRCSRR
jgi:hypothetical protein